MVKAILHGACGRMGHIIADIVSRDPEIEIIAGVDAFGSAYAGFPVYASLDECREEADVVIDFSTASAIDGLLAYSAEHAVPVVVCTTGLSEEQTANLKKTAEKKPAEKKPAAKKPAAKKAAEVIIQSELGGEITADAILAKVGAVDKIYVRVDQNKAYWVRGEETGSVDLW